MQTIDFRYKMYNNYKEKKTYFKFILISKSLVVKGGKYS